MRKWYFSTQTFNFGHGIAEFGQGKGLKKIRNLIRVIWWDPWIKLQMSLNYVVIEEDVVSERVVFNFKTLKSPSSL